MTKRFRVWAATVASVVASAAVLAAVAAPFGVSAAQPANTRTLQTAQSPDVRVDLNIPAQALDSALTAFADQAGLHLLFASKDVAGRRTEGLSGSLSPEDALKRLLAGTGMTWRFTDAKTVVLEKPKPDGALTLDPITIEGKGVPRQAEIGNLPPVYPGGQVARGGSVGLLGNQDVFDTPFNMTSYTSELIENQQAKNLADVVHNDPSAYLINAEKGSSHTIAIRGFNTGGNGGSLYDGLPGMSHRRFSTVESLERVEIFKGANSLLTGAAGRVGGTVNLVPKRPLDDPLTQATATYEADSRFGGQADVSRRFGSAKQFGIRVNGVYHNGESTPENNDEELKETSLAMDFHGERFRANVVLDYSDQEVRAGNQLFSGVSSVPKAPDTSAAVQQPWEVVDNNFMRGLIRLEYDVLKDWTAFAAFGATDFDGSWFRTTGSGLTSGGDFTQSAQDQRDVETNYTGAAGVKGRFETGPITHKLSFEALRNESKSGRDRQNIAGYSVASNIFDPVFVSKPGFTPLTGDVPTTFKGVSNSIALADVLGFFDERALLTIGFRHQRVNSENISATTHQATSIYDESAITPAVGLVVKPWRALSLYGNYIESLEQGSTAPSTAANAGEVFPPAKTKQIEFGAKYDFGKLGLTAGVFQLERPSGITDSNNQFSIDGEQRHRGVELSAFGELMSGLRVLSGMTFIDAKLTNTANGTNDGNTAGGVPDFAAVLGLEWDMPILSGLTLSFRANHMGRQYINSENTKEIPSYRLFSLGARYTHKVGNRDLIFRANVSNLFDEDYWITFPGSSNLLYYGAPRVVSFSVSMKF